MSSYIAYLDILGTRNCIECGDFDDYIDLIVCFQNTLLRSMQLLDVDGRIYFFSECAYIESYDLDAIVNVLKNIRDFLFDEDIFIRGSLIEGKLGALNCECAYEYDRYKDDLVMYEKMKPSIHFFAEANSIYNASTIDKNKLRGTLFFSRDVARAYSNEAFIKSAAYNVDRTLVERTKKLFVKSAFLSASPNEKLNIFYDIYYSEESITMDFLNKILRIYLEYNINSTKLGCYYLSILISCINSVNYSEVYCEPENNVLINTPPILMKILNLHRENASLCKKAKGLEYLYFSLIEKIYQEVGDKKTRQFIIKKLFMSSKIVGKYSNRISELPKDLLSGRTKGKLQRELAEILTSRC